MRSSAAIGTHPIHPMLIPFPIAFLSGSLAFDIISRVVSSQALYQTAGHCMIAGVVMGFVAAIPGLIDFIRVIPVNSRAKNKATYHMIVNSVALIAFLVSFLARPPFEARNYVSVLPAYLGFLFLSIGGWLGGVLVYEEKVGIEETFEKQRDSAPPTWEEPHAEFEQYPHH